MRYTPSYNYHRSPMYREWGGALQGAGKGASIGASVGMTFGPIGALIGGAVGAIGGGIFGNARENKMLRRQRKLDIERRALIAEEQRMNDLFQAKVTRENDRAYLNNFSTNEGNSFFMKSGGRISATGVALPNGNKLITNKNGSTAGFHENGSNIPIKRKGRTLAIAEPGEVLINDKSLYPVPFVLSKRFGFAQQFMNLEGNKTPSNEKVIENRQSKLISMNNKLVSGGKLAANGRPLPYSVSNLDTNRLLTRNNNVGIQKYNGMLPTTTTKAPGFFKTTFAKIGTMDSGKMGNIVSGVASGLELAGNYIATQKALKRQRGLIQDSLKESLAYKPMLNKNYLLSEDLDINSEVGAINQGYNSVVSGLQGIDPAIVSAIKNSANLSRVGQLGSIFGRRSNFKTDVRNRNTIGIATTGAGNTDLINQTNLMKLNAKIAANEEMGNAEAASLGNLQGAMGEANSIMRDQQMLNSLRARWKDSIGDGFMKNGGRLCRRRKKVMAY